MKQYKLTIGSVCKLTSVIKGIYACDDWKTGYYKVVRIDNLGYGRVYSGNNKSDPKNDFYGFKKIKKDGTEYKTFNNGYRCQAWDKLIDEGKVEIVELFDHD